MGYRDRERERVVKQKQSKTPYKKGKINKAAKESNKWCPKKVKNITQIRGMKTQENSGSCERLSMEEREDEEISKIAFQAREEEIERKKMEVREKVEYQLSRAEEETRRLAQVWEELEVLGDPMRKEVAAVRKKIDITNRELKSLGQSCQKKEKEYKEALEAFNEKNSEKAQLTTVLVELVKESETLRMSKLEDLTKIIDFTTK